MHPLGSGSDYTVFLDHLGVPSLDIGFSGNYGVYHSIYDDFTWMEKFGDPEFLTHTMAARLYTAIVMRAAAAEVLPLRFTPYAEALRDHVDELRLIQHAPGSRQGASYGKRRILVTSERRDFRGSCFSGQRRASVPGQGRRR